MPRRFSIAMIAAGVLAASLLSGCAVVAVAGAAATVAGAAVTVVGTGVKVAGKAVGAAVDVVTGGDDEDVDKDD